MSEKNSKPNKAGSSDLWKWTTLGLIAFITPLAFGQVFIAKARVAPPAPAVSEEAKAETPKSETQRQKPARRVVAANTQPAPVAPRMPSSADFSACNQAAAAARTQPGEIVRDGVVGGAIGAGVGAASGAIAGGGKGAGKGAGIGAVVGATAGTIYGVNKKAQDDARADAAYRTCMAQRGF